MSRGRSNSTGARDKCRLLLQEAYDISFVFEQKCVGGVFRVAIEKDQQALVIPDEGIDAHVFSAREHIVSAGRKRRFG